MFPQFLASLVSTQVFSLHFPEVTYQALYQRESFKLDLPSWQHKMGHHYTCTSKKIKHAISSFCSVIPNLLISSLLYYSEPQSRTRGDSCCGINGGITLPLAWAPSSTAFNCMPVTAARWPSASSAASRHWLLFLCASVTIDVISDSQPWMGRKLSFQ